MEWKPYDPTWLVELAKAQLPGEIWLPEALSRCISCSQADRSYLHFVDSGAPNEPGSPWQFERNLSLYDRREGEIVLDILEGNRIGGIEFLKRL